MILAAEPQKVVPGVKVLFLDQIPKGPCQPDMTLGFILLMRVYSDGHCTKPNVEPTPTVKDGLFIKSTIFTIQ